jgi:hypothetical protein
MRPLKVFLFMLLMGLMVISCQKDATEPAQPVPSSDQEFVVPDIPDEIASLMSDEDMAMFKAGPGEEFTGKLSQDNARKARGHWYPVLMKLRYHLQFVPIGGESCAPGDFTPCFGPGAPADPTECLASIVGSAGITGADGYWFSKAVHSEFFPVFCGPDYTGYGYGFYQVDKGMLWIEAENGPVHYDNEGNSTFVRKGNYNPEQSTGCFAGAVGWEVAIMYTATEDNPANAPDGIGYSDVVIFGWVYR